MQKFCHIIENRVSIITRDLALMGIIDAMDLFPYVHFKVKGIKKSILKTLYSLFSANQSPFSLFELSSSSLYFVQKLEQISCENFRMNIYTTMHLSPEYLYDHAPESWISIQPCTWVLNIYTTMHLCTWVLSNKILLFLPKLLNLIWGVRMKPI